MRIYTILRNLVQSIKSSLAEAKDYADAVADTKLTNELLYGNIEQSGVSIGGNATTWVTVTVPNDRKIIAPCGAYWFGTNNHMVYSYAQWRINDHEIQFAFRNSGSGAASLTISVNYLYINVGGVTRKLIGWLLPLGKVVTA